MEMIDRALVDPDIAASLDNNEPRGRNHMSEEARINVATGFNGGLSVSLRADSYEEFLTLACTLYGDEAGEIFAADILDTMLKSVPSAKATAVLHSAVGPVSVVGTVPVPQPGASADSPPWEPVQAPPMPNYPCPCTHGARIFKESVTSKGPWKRWDCALPWQKGMDPSLRCKAINC